MEKDAVDKDAERENERAAEIAAKYGENAPVESKDFILRFFA